MDKLRSVNTKFWQDPFIEDLNPTEKLLFLYLLTNPLGNILGIYEISIKRISYDTGIGKETISKALKGFERVGKVFYYNDYIVLANFLKNQKLNSNMWTGAKKIFLKLPRPLIILTIKNTLEGFESLWKALEDFEKYESEIESEIESEKEGEEGEETPPPPHSQIKYYRVIKHLKLTFEEKDKLIDLKYSNTQIDDILDSIENYKLNKNYTSLFITAKKWLERDNNKQSAKSNYSKISNQINQESYEQKKLDPNRNKF